MAFEANIYFFLSAALPFLAWPSLGLECNSALVLACCSAVSGDTLLRRYLTCFLVHGNGLNLRYLEFLQRPVLRL